MLASLEMPEPSIRARSIHGRNSEVRNRFQLWMHVDGSYGAFATLAQSARKLLAGMEHADSIALDPHEWLYLPVDVGCVIYRNPAIARATFAHEAEYPGCLVRKQTKRLYAGTTGRDYFRRFRALKVWMLLKGVGLDRFSEAIESNLACARRPSRWCKPVITLRWLHRSNYRSFVFVTCRRGSKTITKTIDAFNERLLVALQRDGSSYLSNATLGGRLALRGCVLNYSNTWLVIMYILLVTVTCSSFNTQPRSANEPPERGIREIRTAVFAASDRADVH